VFIRSTGVPDEGGDYVQLKPVDEIFEIAIKKGGSMNKIISKFMGLTVATLSLIAVSLPVYSAVKDLPVVVMIATGGTIAMKIDPVKKAPVPAISGEDLLATVPEIAKIARIEVINLANVPSDYMDPCLWVKLQKAV
jgi:L-asparaginase/Glu-tRNA(Gln) amidotransferase subunit D